MLHKSFKPAKCKTSLKLAVARIKLLRNKREVQMKQMRRELAQLLDNGQEQTARIRVEHVIREEKTTAAYDLIELYCELIVARLPIIESQKSCPIDLKEAVSSVIFASPRCADIPELMDLRKHFAAKYGKEFINSALEVRPDCGVSRLVVEKLSARAPDFETKVKTLTAIAQEHNVKWNPKTIEEQLQKPHSDLLNGPTAFASASQMPVESSNVISSPAYSQTGESRATMPQNDTATRPAATSNLSDTGTRTPPTSVPFPSQPEARPSESKYEGRETNNSQRNKNPNMVFEDAAAAAQAAAESAERASMAARAAAEHANRENLSKQNFTGPNVPTSYSRKYEKPEILRAFLDDHIVDESAPMATDELKSSQGMKTKSQNPQKDEIMQAVSRREAGSTSIDYSTANYEMADANLHTDDVKDYIHARRITYESEADGVNRLNVIYDNAESRQENINFNSNKAASSPFIPDDEKFWNSNVYKHENDEGETYRTDSGEVSFGNEYKQATFDDYGSDAEDNNSIFGRTAGSFFNSSQVDKGSFSDQNRTGSPVTKNNSPQLHLFTESTPEEYSETTTKVTFPSLSTDSAPPAFDDSDRESEDEVAVNPSEVLHDHGRSRRTFSDQSTFESNHIYMGEQKEVKEIVKEGPSPGTDMAPSYSNVFVGGPDYSSSDEEEPLHLTKRQPVRETETKEKPEVAKVEPSSRSDKAPSYSNVFANVPDYSSSDEEDRRPSRLTKRQPSRETEAKEKSEVSNEFSDDESSQGINFGRLTGGFKHRGFPRPPYAKSSVVDASKFSKQTANATSISNIEKQSPSIEVTDQKCNQESKSGTSATRNQISGVPRIDNLTETYAGSEILDQEQYDKKSHMKAYKESRSRTAYSHAGSREEQSDSNFTAASRVNAGVKYSRRTRDVPSESKTNSMRVPQPLPNTTYDAVTKSSKPSQPDSMDNVISTNKSAKPSSAIGESVSRESSKSASHIHPKLPDYESLAARFHSLRSNQH